MRLHPAHGARRLSLGRALIAAKEGQLGIALRGIELVAPHPYIDAELGFPLSSIVEIRSVPRNNPMRAGVLNITGTR